MKDKKSRSKSVAAADKEEDSGKGKVKKQEGEERKSRKDKADDEDKAVKKRGRVSENGLFKCVSLKQVPALRVSQLQERAVARADIGGHFRQGPAGKPLD